mmetsp:Transcript_14650/g.37609  ORF Transcript_14650/g.37609 Transcript_14650/m.37609 type:complete len:265 (+) Transcript_14650:531-1325(+)
MVLVAAKALGIPDGELLELMGLLCDLLEVRQRRASYRQGHEEDEPDGARNSSHVRPQGLLLLGAGRQQRDPEGHVERSDGCLCRQHEGAVGRRHHLHVADFGPLLLELQARCHFEDAPEPQKKSWVPQDKHGAGALEHESEAQDTLPLEGFAVLAYAGFVEEDRVLARPPHQRDGRYAEPRKDYQDSCGLWFRSPLPRQEGHGTEGRCYPATNEARPEVVEQAERQHLPPRQPMPAVRPEVVNALDPDTLPVRCVTGGILVQDP